MKAMKGHVYCIYILNRYIKYSYVVRKKQMCECLKNKRTSEKILIVHMIVKVQMQFHEFEL